MLKEEWLASDWTVSLLREVEESVEATMAGWANGAYTGASADETAQMNAKALGFVDAMLQIEATIKERVDD